MSDFGLSRVNPDEPEKCSDETHVFEGSDVGTKCRCGAEVVTEEDVESMSSSPMGMLMAANLCMPIVVN